MIHGDILFLDATAKVHFCSNQVLLDADKTPTATREVEEWLYKEARANKRDNHSNDDVIKIRDIH